MKKLGHLSSISLKDALNVTYFESLPSTSDYAKQSYNQLKYPHAVVTDNQTKGHGRRDRQWLASKAGDSFYCTWVFHLKQRPSPVLPMRIGHLLYFHLNRVFGNIFALKAPNDIYIEDKKVAGILLEAIDSQTEFFLLVGIGINVLSPPPINEATYIAKRCELNEKIWISFLKDFSDNLCLLSSDPRTILNPSEQQNLLKALKKHKDYQNLLSVSPKGDLNFQDKTLPWTDL